MSIALLRLLLVTPAFSLRLMVFRAKRSKVDGSVRCVRCSLRYFWPISIHMDPGKVNKIFLHSHFPVAARPTIFVKMSVVFCSSVTIQLTMPSHGYEMVFLKSKMLGSLWPKCLVCVTFSSVFTNFHFCCLHILTQSFNCSHQFLCSVKVLKVININTLISKRVWLFSKTVSTFLLIQNLK